MEQCVIRADRDGLVIYPNSEEWKDAPDITEGATIHNDQVLLLMPDLSKMQLRVGIHESMVDSVEVGMSATVTLPEQTLEGKVISVASTAEPAGWWTGNIVKYDAVIALPNARGLRPGMTAKVQIMLATHDDVLRIPLSALRETDHGCYCWVGTPNEAERRKLVLGDSNETTVEVLSGLREGERVVLDASFFADN